MIHKTVMPESFNFGQPSVQIVGTDSTRLNKTAMLKRAAAFDVDIAELSVDPKKTYLHVITTGAGQQYGPNLNGDYFNGKPFTLHPPMPKNASCKELDMDGGLQKYHDDSYKHGGKVYQEHKTEREGAKASGQVIAAHYNGMMKRGELLIAVNTDEWSQRLNKKAGGQNIFLSIGCDVNHDTCSICGNQAHSTKEYCGHVKTAKLQIDDQGNQVCMINDAPKFYDISGVNVPADKMAFVISKVASGAPARGVVKQARYTLSQRAPIMPLTKLASLLSKMSAIEKQLLCKVDDDALFADHPKAKKDFILIVKNYPVDQIVSGCNRKGMLLTPDMLFKLMGKQTSNPDMFSDIATKCCGNCGGLMQRMEQDPDFTPELLNGSFDQAMPADLGLDSLLQGFMPQFGVTRNAINRKSINIVLSGQQDKVQQLSQQLKDAITQVLKKHQGGKSQEQPEQDAQEQPENTEQPEEPEQDQQEQSQDQDLDKKASIINHQFERTYARYLLSFAAKNSDDTCQFALQKLARYNKVTMA